MIAGEIRDIATLAELRDLPPGAVICDARGWIGTLAQRAGSMLVDGVYWTGSGGRFGGDSINFPVQAWWPRHPALVAKGA